MAHLLRGGRIAVESSSAVSAMVIEDGRIAWLGRDEEADDLVARWDARTDLDGALVTPGFVDAHVHATTTGLTLLGLDLSSARSAAEILDAVARVASRNPGSLILGHGWDHSQWPEPSLPTAEELSRATSHAAVYLTRVDAHSALVSTPLVMAVPQVRGMRGYADSGWVSQEAHHALRDYALGSLNSADTARAQEAFLTRALECGIVAVHEMAGPVISSEADCKTLLTISRSRPAPLVTAYWGELAQSGGIDRARGIGARGAGGDLFVDGSLGSRTACMLQPYRDAPETRGREFIDAESVATHVDLCARAGMQTGFHAIGDAATQAVIAAYSRAESKHGRERFMRQRHRLEHAESVGESDIRECARLGIVASMQPVFDARWGGQEGMYAERLGWDRARMLNPIGDLHRRGVTVAFGSDAPVTPLDPWAAVHAAVNHHSPSQRVSHSVALAAHSRAGWHAVGVDDAGRLDVGYAAHLAIWEATQPGGVPVAGETALRTVIGGECVYDSGHLEDRT
jgi:predicted amidohydrolase YtcJ